MESNKQKDQTQKKSVFLLKKYNERVKLITFIYQSELFEEKIDVNYLFEHFDLSKRELDSLTIISEKYDLFQSIAKRSILEQWTWQRIQPLARAIIIYGIFELFFNSPKVVINEMVNIAKSFIPDDSTYKFVNRTLDMIAKSPQFAKEA
ncbi:transcription termination factor [Metamycoplasma arthritidis]|uniref:Transcription termination factor n=1 Tax=Metamycoplasma arthritidis (strain 158L3-1) TaxID=243272 RepID=B3PM53_META1|nr:transcription antitermination protein NusB [Metamycoplasma arthritidis]ACF07105.1 transcription termination factor [Metamycoplasma arthritidis 158L3-1]VEU78633.1 transcription termination factor [Metamycoplasma arthritidis]